MRKKLYFIFIVLAFFGVVITGCDKSDNQNNKTKKDDVVVKDNIVGEYDLYSMTEDDTTMNMEELKEFGISGTLVVKSDKSAVLKLMDEEDEDNDEEVIKYDDKYFYDDESDEKISYTYEKGILTLTSDDETMVFKKK